MNGDGFGDFVVGDPGTGFHGAESGAAYIVFGTGAGFDPNIDFSRLDGTNGFRLIGGAAGDRAGASVAAAGDVNDDGFDDILCGAPGTDHRGSGSGSAYVVYGRPKFRASINLGAINGTGGFRMDGGTAGEGAGSSVAAAGDVDGDGFADLIVGAPGAAPHGPESGSSYVVFGDIAAPAQPLNLASLDGKTGFRLDGGAEGDSSGLSVAGAGDVNGDGFDDVIVGAPGASAAYVYGFSYVVYGKQSGFSARTDLSGLNGVDGFRFFNSADSYGGEVGQKVAGVGDVNGDGFDDVATISNGVYGHDYYDTGAIFVLFGGNTSASAAVDLADLDGSNGFRFEPESYVDDYSCVDVSGAGDVNGDGFDDVLVGACSAKRNVSYIGKGYVIFGKATPFSAYFNHVYFNGANGFQVEGIGENEDTGGVVSGLSDITGDGFSDFALIARSGTYVLFGRAPDSARTRDGSAASQYISGGDYPDRLRSKGGWDVLEGRGGPDVLIGGPGSDLASYVHAPSQGSPLGVRASLASPASNTGDAAGDSYLGIEGLEGSRLNDRLIGDGAGNRIYGGLGRDVLTGGPGPDIFGFATLRDSRPGAPRDIITDFDAGTAATAVDKIDVRRIDAVAGPGNQSFRFIGTAAFSHTAGEIRIQRSGTSTVVMGDVNGDAAPDLEIELQNFAATAALTAIDFMR